MKKLIIAFLSLMLILSFPCSSYSEVNAGNGGTRPGQGDPENNWPYPYPDGVRVTIVDRNTQMPVRRASSFDWLRDDLAEAFPDEPIYNFGSKKSKLEYLSGDDIDAGVSTGHYSCIVASSVPPIIQDGEPPNIAEIKQYFGNETVLRKIAEDSDIFEYDELIQGDYVILLEPIAIFKYINRLYAMTATEYAIFEPQTYSSGAPIHTTRLNLLVRYNLPVSLFLEHDDLEISSYSPSSYQYPGLDVGLIFRTLGVAVVSFDPNYQGDVSALRFTYHTDTDVITPVVINSDSEIPEGTFSFSPGLRASEYFNTDSGNFAIESGDTYVWTKWHTPSQPTSFTINFTASEGTPSSATIYITIINPSENIPLDPAADGSDKPSHFSYSSPSLDNSKNYAAWHVQAYVPNPYYNVDVDEDDDDYDDNEYIFERYEYSATLTIDGVAKISPDARVPTAIGTQMGSGYGVNASVKPDIHHPDGDESVYPYTAYDKMITSAQNIKATFSEFNYATYNRFLEYTSGGEWGFKKNPYSRYQQRVHFTPVWYPDGPYAVKFELMDAWTPGGELRYETYAADVTINGSVYDDYYVQRAQW